MITGLPKKYVGKPAPEEGVGFEHRAGEQVVDHGDRDETGYK